MRFDNLRQDRYILLLDNSPKLFVAPDLSVPGIPLPHFLPTCRGSTEPSFSVPNPFVVLPPVRKPVPDFRFGAVYIRKEIPPIQRRLRRNVFEDFFQQRSPWIAEVVIATDDCHFRRLTSLSLR